MKNCPQSPLLRKFKVRDGGRSLSNYSASYDSTQTIYNSSKTHRSRQFPQLLSSAAKCPGGASERPMADLGNLNGDGAKLMQPRLRREPRIEWA